MAATLASLAAARHGLGEYASAEELYRRALSIFETTLAPNDVTTATTLESLAETCVARGRISEAVSLCNRALSIREATLGPSDMSVRKARARIADLQLETQDESRFSTPPRSAPALPSSRQVDLRTPERTPIAGASPLPPVLMPQWASPEVIAVRVPWEGTPPTTLVARRPTAIVVVAGIVVVVAAAMVFKSQQSARRDANMLADAEKRLAAATVAALVPPAPLDSLSIAASRDVIDTVPATVAPRAVAPSVVARERPLPQAPSPARATTATDSAALRTVTPPAEARARNEPGAVPTSTAPTSPTLIGAAPLPQYPAALREQQVEGEVVVQFVVDETGRPDVSSMTVVRSPHVLLTNAVHAVLSQLRYEPARTAAPQSTPRPETVRFAFSFRAPRS